MNSALDSTTNGMTGPALDQSLRRFWFVLSGGRGIGVTAASEFEARGMAEPVRTHFWPDEAIVRVICDVDVNSIDDAHAQLTMGPIAVRGVWYPRPAK
jgi:hypothetical protein